MARHCVKWASGRKKTGRGRRGGKKCAYGKLKNPRGRRVCRKRRGGRRRRTVVRTGYRRMAP
jgi:hypothetical protein